MFSGPCASTSVGIISSLASPIIALLVNISIVLSLLIDNLMIENVISLSFSLSLGDNNETLSTASTNESLLNLTIVVYLEGIILKYLDKYLLIILFGILHFYI